MSTWREYKSVEIDGVRLVVEERMDLRNRNGAMEYIISAYIGGRFKRSERIDQSKWLGHCYGQLLLPEIAKRAKGHIITPEGGKRL